MLSKSKNNFKNPKCKAKVSIVSVVPLVNISEQKVIFIVAFAALSHVHFSIHFLNEMCPIVHATSSSKAKTNRRTLLPKILLINFDDALGFILKNE